MIGLNLKSKKIICRMKYEGKNLVENKKNLLNHKNFQINVNKIFEILKIAKKNKIKIDPHIKNFVLNNKKEIYYVDIFPPYVKQYEKLRLPKGFKLATDGNQYHIPYREMRNYLKSRGITEEMIKKHSIGYSLEGDYAYRIIVPSFDREGELNYYTGRSWNPNSKAKYKNPEAEKQIIIFNESLIDWSQDIYLCEGPFDSLFLPNSIPLLGKKMSDVLFDKIYDEAKSNVVIVLDSDAWEDSKRLYFKLSGGKLYGRIKVVKLPEGKDIADLRGDLKPEYYIELEK